jgi:hypothetical protein
MFNGSYGLLHLAGCPRQAAQWNTEKISYAESDDPDGSAWILAILDGKPDTYKARAEDYYETPVSSSADAHALLDAKTFRYSLGYNRSTKWIHMESSIRYLARHGRLSASYMSLPCLVLLLTGKTSQRSQTRRYVKLAFTKRPVFTV